MLMKVVTLRQPNRKRTKPISGVLEVQGVAVCTLNDPREFQIIAMCRKLLSIILLSSSSNFVLFCTFFVNTTEAAAHNAAIKLLKMPIK